jgi:hypothetical protein
MFGKTSKIATRQYVDWDGPIDADKFVAAFTKA